MPTAEKSLEFQQIKELLCDMAQTPQAKESLSRLAPMLTLSECLAKQQETTNARRIYDQFGAPPLPAMESLDKIMILCEAGSALSVEQLIIVAQYAVACKRVKAHLQRAECLDVAVAFYGQSLQGMPQLQEEIERCIRHEQIDSAASPALREIRRKGEYLEQQIKERVNAELRSKKSWLSDGYVGTKGGRYVLPVKKQFRSQFPGSVVEVSAAGTTYFMEPASVAKLRQERDVLLLEEDQEILRILYTLTALVSEHLTAIKSNREVLIALDLVFAKAKLSAHMAAGPVILGLERRWDIRQARHPLLEAQRCVPLDFVLADHYTGVVITGPNTGGKTVVLKTVGLLSMMAQSGLHVPAAADSYFCLCSQYLCDIGDGQSISENLSTFSAHMTNIVDILAKADKDSLILLDELGSGTDPAEGMGIAIAVLEELQAKGCLFLVTTHYPEIKTYAAEASKIQNARMCFDQETLSPLYRLELGKAGESCALAIARRLGLSNHLLERAWQAAYEGKHGPIIHPTPHPATHCALSPAAPFGSPLASPLAQPRPADNIAPAARLQESNEQPRPNLAGTQFKVGDSVLVSPHQEIGLVYRPVDRQGNLIIQVKGKKMHINHKRLKLYLPAEELYPEDYDLSIVFDTVANRKARKKMSKGYAPEYTVHNDDKI